MANPSSPDGDHDAPLRKLAALAPQQLAAEIRDDAGQVHEHAKAWRNSSHWTGDEHDQHAYQTVLGVTVSPPRAGGRSGAFSAAGGWSSGSGVDLCLGLTRSRVIRGCRSHLPG